MHFHRIATRIFIASSIIFILILISSSNCPASAETVVAAVFVDFPPTCFKDPVTGKAAGFAVDVMDEVAKLAGLDVKYVFGESRDDLHAMVLDGRADLIPNMAVSEARKASFAFTREVETVTINFVTRESGPSTSRPPPGMRVGVLKGCISKEYLDRRPELELRPVVYDGLKPLLFDLLAGKIDVALGPAPNIRRVAADVGIDEKFRISTPPVLEGKRAMALRPRDRELLARLDDAIGRLHGSQRYQEIYTKWWGKPAPYWNTRRILALSGTVAIVSIFIGLSWHAFLLRRMNKRLKEESASLQVAQDLVRINEERLRALVDILQHDFITFQEYLDHALSEAISLTASRFGYIYLYDERKEEFSLNSWSKDVMPACAVAEKQTTYALDKTGLWGEAVRQRKPILVNDYGTTSQWKRGTPEGHVQLTTFLTIPIFKGEAIVAVVGVANKASGYDQTDILQLTLLMDSVWKAGDRMRMKSEQAALEAKFAHSQKMEAVGRLAGGIAHDFNNKLSVILGYAELAGIPTVTEAKRRDYIAQIATAANHARDITRQLLAFSRHEVISPRRIDLNAQVRDTVKVLSRLIGEDIRLSVDLSAESWPVRLDPSQVDQILMNLAVNARDAMPEGGSILLATVNAPVSDVGAPEFPDAVPGDFVRLSVIDTGTGMAEETRSHIFEPFFTTKETGKGTGLGLATVYGIVAQNGGFIRVESDLGAGTTFDVYFPRMTEGEATPSVADDDGPTIGAGSILLVEDDPSVRELTESLLREIGYKVAAFGSPAEAVEASRDARRRFDLLLTDVVMPGMSGKEVAQEVAKARPGLPVLYMSGYTADVIATKGILDEGIQFLQKPFKAADLNTKIRSLLDAGMTPAS